jgi:hypothetical protein
MVQPALTQQERTTTPNMLSASMQKIYHFDLALACSHLMSLYAKITLLVKLTVKSVSQLVPHCQDSGCIVIIACVLLPATAQTSLII